MRPDPDAESMPAVAAGRAQQQAANRGLPVHPLALFRVARLRALIWLVEHEGFDLSRAAHELSCSRALAVQIYERGAALDTLDGPGLPEFDDCAPSPAAGGVPPVPSASSVPAAGEGRS
jgi:hypothetical protein